MLRPRNDNQRPAWALTRCEWRRCYPCRNPQRIRSRNGDQAYREADSGEDREDVEEEGRAEEGGGREIDGEEGRLRGGRSEEHTSELQSLMRISYAVFCMTKKQKNL